MPLLKDRFKSIGIGKSEIDLCAFIPKSMGFSQSLLWFQAGGDLLKVSGLRLKL